MYVVMCRVGCLKGLLVDFYIFSVVVEDKVFWFVRFWLVFVDVCI